MIDIKIQIIIGTSYLHKASFKSAMFGEGWVLLLRSAQVPAQLSWAELALFSPEANKWLYFPDKLVHSILIQLNAKFTKKIMIFFYCIVLKLMYSKHLIYESTLRTI